MIILLPSSVIANITQPITSTGNEPNDEIRSRFVIGVTDATNLGLLNLELLVIT